MPEEPSRPPQGVPIGSGQQRDTPPLRMSYEEFLERPEDAPRAEWVDGMVVEMTPVSRRHQIVLGFLYALLREFTEVHDLGEVLFAPFQMKTGPTLAGREPDLAFVAKAHSDRIRRVFIDGPADLAVEIISPNSVTRNRRDKFAEYERGGVREYWIIDPENGKADFWALGATGRYEPIELEGGVFRSRVLDGVWLRAEWLVEDPPPKVADVLRR